MCPICIQSKQTRLSFNRLFRKYSKRPLEIVHSDICGPISPSTFDDKNYFVTFLDDYTHFSIVYLIKNKSELFQCFREYEASQ